MEKNRYAVVRTSSRKPLYTVGRVIEIDLTDYVFPISDGKSWHITFTRKELARAYAGTLGDVLPGIWRQDFTRQIGFAVKAEALSHAHATA